MGKADPVRAGDLDDYFATARRFDQDAALEAHASARRAWRVAGGASVLTVLSLIAVACLAPLKSVEPFVIRVDNTTGIVDVVSAITGPNTYTEATTKYFAGLYVRAREGFAASEAETNFRTVALMSVPAEQRRFQELYRGSNPQSPQVLYGKSASVRITISSVSILDRNVASVRYLKTVLRGEDTQISHWIATLTFTYSNGSMTAADRQVNPLGFLVGDFKADAEAIP
ncbi:MAG: virB8 family protein [Hyphomicrobium sp.]|nr:virB8 family protein [Hyphomicrobium sp.]